MPFYEIQSQGDDILSLKGEVRITCRDGKVSIELGDRKPERFWVIAETAPDGTTHLRIPLFGDEGAPPTPRG